MDMKKKLIYISHPSSGLESNTRKVEDIIRNLYKNKEFRDKYCVISPIHNFGFMYNDEWLSYDDGLNLCLDLLDSCDIMLVFGDYTNSKGCTREIEYCKENEINTIIVGNLNSYETVFSLLGLSK